MQTRPLYSKVGPLFLNYRPACNTKGKVVGYFLHRHPPLAVPCRHINSLRPENYSTDFFLHQGKIRQASIAPGSPLPKAFPQTSDRNLQPLKNEYGREYQTLPPNYPRLAELESSLAGLATNQGSQIPDLHA